MEAFEYRHEARVREGSWFIRLYLWAWEARIEEMDFCRLFWGYIFMPLNLLLRAIVTPFYLAFLGLRWTGRRIGLMFGRAMSSRSSSRAAAPSVIGRGVAPSPPRKQRKRRDYTRILAFASRAGDRVVAGSQATWRVIRWPVRILLYVSAVVVAGAIVALTFYGVYWLGVLVGEVAPPVWDWIRANAPTAGLILLIAVGGLAVLGAILLGGFYAATETPVGPAVRTTTLGFFGMMRTGFYGVKSRTCPRIVVEREERS